MKQVAAEVAQMRLGIGQQLPCPLHRLRASSAVIAGQIVRDAHAAFKLPSALFLTIYTMPFLFDRNAVPIEATLYDAAACGDPTI